MVVRGVRGMREGETRREDEGKEQADLPLLYTQQGADTPSHLLITKAHPHQAR